MRGRTNGQPHQPRSERHDFWGVVLDAPDAFALAQFYATLLGWQVNARPGDTFVSIAPPDGVAYLATQTALNYRRPVWPNVEGEQQMMFHLDFEVSDLATAMAHACELGAVLADEQPQAHVRVLLDPAGHPFCLYLDH